MLKGGGKPRLKGLREAGIMRMTMIRGIRCVRALSPAPSANRAIWHTLSPSKRRHPANPHPPATRTFVSPPESQSAVLSSGSQLRGLARLGRPRDVTRPEASRC
ncbi:hypothetical protein EJ06DRAFT_85945 [Trichodelitschia bisporula]|uniref:Uncharacterized protein n=1 Tax=Trichodelitschia bisporula TaxID=703511 RepID=A0A6G1HSC0_9PEZI|nr:hypothetical protein EJ06DRAFT_85945 [Trichodelitschia bisporula]